MIGIIGGGAFGTAMAIAMARNGEAVTLWARDAKTGVSRPRLPGVHLPEDITLTGELQDLGNAEVILIALPTQVLSEFLVQNMTFLDGRVLIACCKGIDLRSGHGPVTLINTACSAARVALLTGPSFAVDIARSLPTALTLACADDGLGHQLQTKLSTKSLRLYRTQDVVGAELGGALKNVIAIAAGIAIGAGLGESARAALMTRGYAEMLRFAMSRGARSETLAGLSGLGDLVLTCTSVQSRNFRYGLSLGGQQHFDATLTVEGRATAAAVSVLAQGSGVDLPITNMVTTLADGSISLSVAIETLYSRPLRQE